MALNIHIPSWLSRWSFVTVAHRFPLALNIYKLALHVFECLIDSCFWFITWFFISGTTTTSDDVRDRKDDMINSFLVWSTSPWDSGPLMFRIAGDNWVLLSCFFSSMLGIGILLFRTQVPFSEKELFLLH